MRARGAALLAALVALAPAAAHAARTEADAAREDVGEALREGKYGFCTKPRKPLMPRQAALCPLADEVDGCEGFARACEIEPPKQDLDWLARLVRLVAPAAKALLWILVASIVVLAAIPIVRALLRWRRARSPEEQRSAAPNVAEPLAPPPVSTPIVTDAEAALRAADEHAARGELDRALSLYLAASLAALDRRGAIRLAKHRTNGEYVRSCADEPARAALREIVHEVDRAWYGKLPASGEAIARVASKATALVRVAIVAIVALLLAGCGALPGGGPDDPAGDDLPRDLLRRSGMSVSHLESSLATMPPSNDLVIVDATRTQLEEETQAHLMRWIEQGGHALLLGAPGEWPRELGAKPDAATTRDLDVGRGFLRGARVARADAVAWPAAVAEATLGDRVYAAAMARGEGAIMGVANADLFTNVGASRPDNAAALVHLVRVAAAGQRSVKIARPEDGIPPPSSPFAALARAGLAKGAWHALAASFLVFLAFGIRQARARPSPPPARRAFAEHVEATGAFWRRTRSHALALAAYGRFAELRLRERLPRGADPAAFLAARAGVSVVEARRLWARASEAAHDGAPRGDELRTIAELRALLAKAL